MNKKREKEKDNSENYRKKFIIVDADNTLYHFNKAEAYKEMFESLSRSLSISASTIEKEFLKILAKIKKSKDIEKRRREYSLNLLLDKISQHLSEERKKVIINEAISTFWKTVYNTIRPVKGVQEFINKASTSYNIVVYSDEFSHPLKQKLKIALGNEILKNLKGIISSEEVKVMKPSPLYIDKILSVYNISARDIEYAIGDDFKRDLEDAKRRKIKTILIKKEKEDFIEAYNSIKEGSKMKVDIIIHNFCELSSLLKL